MCDRLGWTFDTDCLSRDSNLKQLFPSLDIQLLVLLCHHETLLLQHFLGSGLVVSCNTLQLLLSSLPLCLNLLSWKSVSTVVFFLVSVVAVIFHFRNGWCSFLVFEG